MRQTIAALLAVAAMGSGCESGALAADMPVKAQVAVPYYNWTGLYAGLNGGYGWTKDQVNMDPNTSPGSLLRYDLGLFPASLGGRTAGFVGGGQLGYNFQSGKIVYGIEADYDYANINGSAAVTLFPAFVPGISLLTASNKKIESFGTLRARLGLAALDRSLIYATGGMAFGRAQLSSSLTASFGCGPVGICASNTTTAWRAGWTLGAGWEYAFANNWSGKIEYLYYDLGTISQTFADPAGPTILFGSSTRFNGSIVRAGLNYRFGL